MSVLCPVWLIIFRSTYMRYKHVCATIYNNLASSFPVTTANLFHCLQTGDSSEAAIHSDCRNSTSFSLLDISNFPSRFLGTLDFLFMCPCTALLCCNTSHMVKNICGGYHPLNCSYIVFVIRFHRILTPLLPTYNTPSYGGAA